MQHSSFQIRGSGLDEIIFRLFLLHIQTISLKVFFKFLVKTYERCVSRLMADDVGLHMLSKVVIKYSKSRRYQTYVHVKHRFKRGLGFDHMTTVFYTNQFGSIFIQTCFVCS